MIETTFEEMQAVALKSYWSKTEATINGNWAVFTYKTPFCEEPQRLHLRLKPIDRKTFHTGNWNLQMMPLPSFGGVNGYATESVVIVGWTAEGLRKALCGGTGDRYTFRAEPDLSDPE
jgi:hypothetical protein